MGIRAAQCVDKIAKHSGNRLRTVRMSKILSFFLDDIYVIPSSIHMKQKLA